MKAYKALSDIAKRKAMRSRTSSSHSHTPGVHTKHTLNTQAQRVEEKDITRLYNILEGIRAEQSQRLEEAMYDNSTEQAHTHTQTHTQQSSSVSVQQGNASGVSASSASSKSNKDASNNKFDIVITDNT